MATLGKSDEGGFRVEPLADVRDDILEEARRLPLACLDGLDVMIGRLERRDPNMAHRCGLLDGRYEIFAIPIPDCGEMSMLISVDISAKGAPRILHGTTPTAVGSCEQGRRVATIQLRLVNPPWEPA